MRPDTFASTAPSTAPPRRAMADSDGLLVLGEGARAFAPGTPVDVLPY